MARPGMNSTDADRCMDRAAAAVALDDGLGARRWINNVAMLQGWPVPWPKDGLPHARRDQYGAR